jgi:hypothetical protein
VIRRILVTLAVLAVLFVAADRIGNYLAERAAGDTLQSSQHLAARPDVDIGGFPFLTQLASRDFDQITVTADNVPIGDQSGLRLSRLQVVLRHLTVSRNFRTFHARTGTASATLDYAQLGNALGVQLSYAGAGRVRASKQVTVAGHTLSGTLTSRPGLSGGALGFADTTIQGAGELGAAVADVLDKVFAVHIPLGGIPFDVHVTALHAAPAGIVIDLAGSDLSYTRSAS